MSRSLLAKNLRDLRWFHELSISELAERSGINAKTIRNIEAGKHAATVDTLELLAKALDVPVSHLTNGPPSGRSSTSRWFSAVLRNVVAGLTTSKREQIVSFSRRLQEPAASDETTK